MDNQKEGIDIIIRLAQAIKMLRPLKIEKINISDSEGGYTQNEKGEYENVHYSVIAEYTENGEKKYQIIDSGTEGLPVYRAIAELFAAAFDAEVEINAYYEASKYTSN